jgi:hypothetical protein
MTDNTLDAAIEVAMPIARENGGDDPVNGDVVVWFANGEISANHSDYFDWNWTASPSDIIAYLPLPDLKRRNLMNKDDAQ